MKIERIQSPTIGGSIPVLRRNEDQESDNGRYVGAADTDPHKKRGGRYYPPKEQSEERGRKPTQNKSEDSALLTGEDHIHLLDITV